jgi:hypothetical protein
MGKQTKNQRRRYVPRQSSGIGLLFLSAESYSERMWKRAYDAAVAAGKTPEQASKLADNEVRSLKAKE